MANIACGGLHYVHPELEEAICLIQAPPLAQAAAKARRHVNQACDTCCEHAKKSVMVARHAVTDLLVCRLSQDMYDMGMDKTNRDGFLGLATGVFGCPMGKTDHAQLLQAYHHNYEGWESNNRVESKRRGKRRTRKVVKKNATQNLQPREEPTLELSQLVAELRCVLGDCVQNKSDVAAAGEHAAPADKEVDSLWQPLWDTADEEVCGTMIITRSNIPQMSVIGRPRIYSEI